MTSIKYTGGRGEFDVNITDEEINNNLKYSNGTI